MICARLGPRNRKLLVCFTDHLTQFRGIKDRQLDEKVGMENGASTGGWRGQRRQGWMNLSHVKELGF